MSKPLVHSEETSRQISPNLTYRELRIRNTSEEHEASQELYEALDRRDSANRLELFYKCRTFAFFAWHRPTGSVRVSSNACRLRWCPICSGSKAKQITFGLEKYVRSLKTPKFLTLTQKHSNAPLKHQIDSLYKNFQKLRRAKLWKDKVKGGIWFFQIKKSKESGQWHPHLHICLDAEYIWREDLSKLWLSITLTSNVIDIRAVKTPKKTAEYIARYSARPSSLSSLNQDERIEVFDSLHRRRICGCFGSAHGLNLTSPESPDHSEYVNIGNYNTVRKLISIDPNASLIWKSWLKGDPIACPKPVVPPEVVSFDRLEKPWLYFSYDDFDWRDSDG